MVGGHHHKKSSTGNKVQCSLAHTSESDGAPFFCFCHHVSEEIRALANLIFSADVSRFHLFQHLVPSMTQNFLRPVQQSFAASKPLSLHNFAAKSGKTSLGNSVTHLRTPTVLFFSKRIMFWTFLPRFSVSRAILQICRPAVHEKGDSGAILH